MPTCPVARRLREARIRAGLLQRELGEAAGLDGETAGARLSRYETGLNVPSFSTLSAIGRVLGVPVAWFYAESDALAEAILAQASVEMPQSQRDRMPRPGVQEARA